MPSKTPSRDCRICLTFLLVLAVLPQAKGACTLCNTSLAFAVPKAGRVSGITITFLLDDVFEQLDTVTLQLPQFSRALGTGDLSNVIDPSATVGIAAFTLASWNEANTLLTLTHITPTTIPANTLVTLLVKADAGISLPVNGVPGDDPNYQIRTDTHYQNTVFESIRSTQAVGVLYNSSVTYGSDVPNGETSLSVNFTFSASLVPGDTVTLFLDSFTIASTTAFISSAIICSNPFLTSKACSSGNITGSASDTGLGVSVVFSFTDTVMQLESITLDIPSSAGITLPAVGTSENNALLTIQTDALEGPVVEHPIESSEDVPRITLSYDPPQAGTGECVTHDVSDGSCLTWVDEGAAITFTFTYSLALASNDTVVLQLPNFTRSTLQQSLPSDPIAEIPCAACDVASFALTGTSAALLRRGAWSESAETLTVTLDAAVSSQTTISFTVPASVGLVLPFPAAANDPALTYEVQAAAGSLSATSIDASPAMGAFVRSAGGSLFASTQLSMAGARVGFPGSITLVFTLTGAVTTGQCIGFCGTQAGVPIVASVVREVIGPEFVILTLPGFSRAGGDLGLIPTGSAAFAYAAWDNANAQLKLTSTAATAAGTEVTVTIPASAGIRLPPSGLEKNTNAITVATNAESGPVVATAVAAVQAVGVLSETAVSVAPRKAGVGVEVNVTLRFSQFVAATERFTLALPGFSRDAALPTALASRAWAAGVDFAVYVEWEPAGPSVAIVIGAGGVAAGAELLVSLGGANGIVLREGGIAKVAPRKFWRVTNAAAVPLGWLVAEVGWFSDAACTERLEPRHPESSNVASEGAGLAGLAECTSLSFAPPGVGCVNGTRAATVGELAACKEALCDVNRFPEFVVGEGAGAYVLGRGHGCVVAAGALPGEFAGGADAVCAEAAQAAAHVSDNSSRTFWAAGVGLGRELAARGGYVGVEFGGAVAVQCVTVEQGGLAEAANYSASEVEVQASDDGVTWWGVLGGAVAEGTAAVAGTVVVDSDAYTAPTLAGDAVRGPVQATAVASTPAIGSFSAASSLALGNPVAGEASSVELTLVPAMEVAAGEAITVTLPGFVRDAAASGPLNASVASFVPQPAAGNASGAVSFALREAAPLVASWDAAAAAVEVVLAHTVFPNRSVTITIGLSSGLVVPAAGIAPSACGLGPEVQVGFRRLPNGTLAACGTCEGCSGEVENGVTVSTNASAGPVLREPGTVVRSVQRVGVLANTSLALTQLSPDFALALTVNFTLNRPVTPGVRLFLDLPGFRGAANASGVAEGAGLFGEVSWDSAAGRVTLTAVGTAAAMVPVSVTIPDSLGIQLPAEGLAAGRSMVKLSTDSDQGAVAPVSVGDVPVVGAFTGDVTRLAYEPAEFETDGTALGEGRVASIAVGFSLNRRIAAGEYVAVFLLGFSRADGDLGSLATTDHNVSNLDANFSTVDTNGVFAAFTSGSWVEATSTLTLFAARDVAPNQRHVVLVPSAAGIRLPKVGLVENDPRILISTNAAAGPNSGSPVQRSPPLKKVCAAECSAWAFTCAGCDCGTCGAR